MKDDEKPQCQYAEDCDWLPQCEATATRKRGDCWFCDEHGNRNEPVPPSTMLASIKDESFFRHLCSAPQGEIDVEYVAKMAVRYLRKVGACDLVQSVTDYCLRAERDMNQ